MAWRPRRPQQSRSSSALGVPPRSPTFKLSKSPRHSISSDVDGWNGAGSDHGGEEDDELLLRQSIVFFDAKDAEAQLPPSQLAMPRSKSLGVELMKTNTSQASNSASTPGSPKAASPRMRPSSAQLKLAVARGMAAAAEAGFEAGEPSGNILVGMRYAGRLVADQAISVSEGHEDCGESVESITERVEGYIADMMNAGRRMAEATVARVNSEISVLRRRTSSGGGASGVPSQESGGVSNSGRTKGLGDVTGTQPDDKLRDAEGGEAVTFVFGGSPARVSEPLDDSGSGVLSDPLATLSATSGEEDSEEDVGGGSTTDDDSGGGCDHGYEDEEYSDVDDDGIDGVGGGSFGGSKGMAGEGGGAPRSQGASWAASGPGRWAVRGVAEAWAEQRSMSATVGAAIGSFDVASGVILDNLQARLNEGAAMARMPITGWDTPDSCPTSPQPKPQQKQRCKGSAKVDKGRGKDVKLVATHAGEFRCAAVCGSAVWLADRSGRIEIRSRAPKFQASGGKVSKVPAVLHCIPAEMDNLVWSMLLVGSHVWVGQEVGPVRVYHAKGYNKVRVLSWHQGGVPAIVATASGSHATAQRRVFTGSLDFSICAWNSKSFKKEAVLSGHTNGVRCLLVVGSTLWSGSDDHTIRVWDILSTESTPECISILEGHAGGVLSLVIAGQGVWSGSADGTIREWAVTGSRQCLRQVAETDRVSTLVPMGLNHVWACGQEPSVTVWDTSKMTPVHRLSGHTKWVNMLVKVEHTETRILWSASLSDKSLRVWQHKNTIDSNDVLNVTELSAANEVLADAGAQLRRQLDAANAMNEAAQEAALEMNEAANQHLTELQLVAEDAVALARERETEAQELRQQVEELEKANADAAEREGALQSDLTSALQELAELKLRSQQERSLNADLRGDNEALQAELERLQTSLKVSETRAARAENQLKASRDELQQALERVQNLADGNTALAADVDKLREENKELQNRVSSVFQQVQALQLQASELTQERDRAQENEALMRRRYKELDVFKLDIIARELKKLDGRINLLKLSGQNLGGVFKAMNQPAEKDSAVRYAQRVTNEMEGCRGALRDVIQQCLTEMQKLHVGFTVGDDRLAAGELENGGVLGGYADVIGNGADDDGAQAGGQNSRQKFEIERERAKLGRSPPS